MRLLLALPLVFGCVALEPPEEFEPFTFRTVHEADFTLTVRDEQGEPVPNALVQLRSEEARVHVQGTTDVGGRFEAMLAMPAHASDFELLVQRRGFSGPHDDETQRLAWGAFAPSSLQRVHRTELRNLSLTLTRGEL